MSHGELPIDELLTRLRLTHSQRVWRDTAMRAANEEWSYQEFLAVLLLQELNHRQAMHTNHLQQLARFPFQKTVAEFEFEWATPQARMVIDSCLDRGFIAEGRSLLLLGGANQGKTHLAVAVATQAIQNGFDALYVRAADLQTALDRAAEQGQWREVLGQYTRPDVLLVDDIDGVTTEKNGLFLVLNERCLARRTVILTARTLPEYWASSGRGGLHTPSAVERLMARGQTLLLDPADSSHDRVTLDLSRRPLLLKDTVSTNTEPAEPAGTLLPATPTPALAEGPERRIHRRHSVDLEVNVTSQHNFFTGFCRDISEGGLFLATYDLRPTGDLIDLHFTLPGGHEIRTTGIVRWQRTWSGEGQEWPGIGVEFLALSPEDKAAILAFFGTREPLFHA